MDALIGAILSLLVNTTNPDYNNQPEKYVTFQEFKEKYNRENYSTEGMYDSLNEEFKPKHFYAEDILCRLSDSVVKSGYDHLAILKSIDDRYIKLSGTVSKVHQNDIFGCWIIINQKRANGLRDGWNYFICYFNDIRENDKIINLKKGDNITLIGHTGFAYWALTMQDCHLK